MKLFGQDPQTGTFISEDPARDGANWYGYCGGNPMVFTDPSGLMSHEEYMNSDDPNKPEHWLQESSFDREVTILESNPSHMALMHSSTSNPINMLNLDDLIVEVVVPNFVFKSRKVDGMYVNTRESCKRRTKKVRLGDLGDEQKARILKKILGSGEALLVSDRLIPMQDVGDWGKDGPCALRSAIAIAELKTGIVLTERQIKNVYERAKEKGAFDLPNGRFMVQNYATIINAALVEMKVFNIEAERLSEDNIIRGLTGAFMIPQGTEYTIVRASAGSSTGDHFGVGDSRGRVIYDPLGTKIFNDGDVSRLVPIGFKSIGEN